MSDDNDDRYKAADYRVRLFLSVDLSGSTAFKNSKDGENRRDGGTPYWVTVFQQFYSDFPSEYAGEFERYRSNGTGSDTCPALWKAVGDELVFCGRVTSKETCAVAVRTFIKTLHNYREKLIEKEISLNVKGAGWLAAFPEPNRTVKLNTRKKEDGFLPASEAMEVAADEDPFAFDFLGKAIDTGFRVASGAQPDKLVLSVQLARLLAASRQGEGFNHTVRLETPRTLKGVNKNEPYPYLFIDTMEHLPTKKAKELEREALRLPDPPSEQKLTQYLEAYCDVVGTDEIMLKNDNDAAEVSPPESYQVHKEKISEHLLGEKQREFEGDENGEVLGDDDSAVLSPATLAPLPSDED